MTTFRNFRQLSTGRWLNVLMAVDGPAFSVLAAVHRDQIAAGWGIALVDVAVSDGPTDLRAGVLVQGPIPPAPTPDPDLAAIRAAVPAWSTLTTVQKVEVVKAALQTIVKDKVGVP